MKNAKYNSSPLTQLHHGQSAIKPELTSLKYFTVSTMLRTTLNISTINSDTPNHALTSHLKQGLDSSIEVASKTFPPK